MQTMRIIQTTAQQCGVFVQMRGVLLKAGTEHQAEMSELQDLMLRAIGILLGRDAEVVEAFADLLVQTDTHSIRVVPLQQCCD